MFTLGGRVFLTELAELGSPAGPPQEIAAHVPAHDPRPDPAGRRMGYVSAGALHVLDIRTGQDRVLAGPDGQPGLSFGLAEFIAAEEMGRMRGYWWAPDGFGHPHRPGR